MKINLVKILILTGVAGLMMSLPQSAAAIVELKLVEPEKFRDIESVGFSRNKSIELINQKMQALFEQLADKHTDGQLKLTIEITEVDLPGYVEHMVGPSNREIRILRDGEPYKLYFNYTALSKTGEIRHQGEAMIKEFYKQRIYQRSNHNNKTLSHFEKPLSKWFKQTFDLQ